MSELIVVGATLTHQPDQARGRLEEFCAALAAAVGVEIQGRPVGNYETLLDDLSDGAVDFAWLPPIVAIRAMERGTAAPMALPVRNGVAAYSAALFTRPGGPKTIGDLNRLRVAWVDRQSASGYLLIRAMLRARSVDLGHAFATEIFLGRHDGVARAVLDGMADVGSTFVYLEPAVSARAGAIRAAGWGEASVQVIAEVGPIPCDILASGSRVPFHVATAVQSALVESQDATLQRAAEALFEAERFELCTEEHFEPLGALLDEIEDGAPPQSLRPPPARKR